MTQGNSANTISEDGAYTGTAYTSTGDDENALRIDDAVRAAGRHALRINVANSAAMRYDGIIRRKRG